MAENSSPNDYEPYWGKARPQAEGPSCHLLIFHSLDVAAVGLAYLRSASGLCRWLQSRMGVENPEVLLSWVSFWIALHDLGKFSISFQGQVPELVGRLQGAVPPTLGLPDVRHDSLGLWLWDTALQTTADREAWFGSDPDVAFGIQSWVRAVMGHHGQPPIEQPRAFNTHFRPQDVGAGVAFTGAARELLLTPEAAALPSRLGADHFVEVSQELSWWVAGLTVLSDWIGSNAETFLYRDSADLSLSEYWKLAQARAEVAVRQCGVLPATRPAEHPFAALFPHITTPSPLQDWAQRIAIHDSPQIHLLEDVTGAGKTEAAVALTHRLMAAGCADGFFIGLPTMATANAMYGRIADLYDRLFEQPVSLALAHRNKRLVEEFAQSVIQTGTDEHDAKQGDETATRRCTRWLADHNKRALLAPAGVGTIDQALLAALQSKHQSLRLLGLMRKVLVVDEVHACDAYMQRTLELLLEFHARAGGSAVLLSATLTQRMKNALLKAFAKGCGHTRMPTITREAYPLTTSWSAEHPARVDEVPISTRPDVQRTVRVRYASDRTEVFRAIRAALDAGQCVAWIRNTIGDAMEAYAELSAHIEPDRIELFHARFTLGDRLDIEERVLTHFGRDSGPTQRAGRLLIATQVAEQSLDIDLDLVVSDLAPIDRLIQRAGRLRRHARDAQGNRLTDRLASDQRGEPWMWVLGPAWTDAPEASWFKKAFPRSANVYPHHGHLWLTAQHLRRGQITMPDDARTLIEGVFGDDESVPAGLQGNANQAEGKSYGDASLADRNSVKLNRGYVRSGLEWDEDTVAPSRLGEDTVDVLLGRWEGDQLLPWRHDKPAQHAWAYSTVRVAKRLMERAVPPTSPQCQAVINSQLEMLPGGGKWIVLLPLECVDGTHQASGLSLGRDGTERITQWQYSRDAGLTAMANNTKEDQ